MSQPWTSDRRRVARILAAAVAGLAVIAGLALVASALSESGGTPTGSALEPGSGGGILQPLPPETPLSLGIVSIRNVSDGPVQLVDARLLRLDADLELLGFSVLPERPDAQGKLPPITALEHPLPGAVPLSEFPPIAPTSSEDPQATVMFALRVRPDGAGKAVGVEVRYRQDGKLRKQVFRQQVYVCWVPTLKDANCPGVKDERDVFGDFEDEVEGIGGRPSRVRVS
ncbi:MAG: hypothetical protein ACRDZ3_18385 [Acidimicrobiia bacterium]